jgi:signal transduction histidine kinase
MKKMHLYSFLILYIFTSTSCKRTDSIRSIGESKKLEFFNKSKIDSLSFTKKKKNINKALSLYDNNVRDSLYLRILRHKCILFGEEKKYDSAQYYLTRLLKESKKQNDSLLIGNTFFVKGVFYSYLERIDSAYYYYEKSRRIFFELKDSIKVGRRLLDMAFIESDKGDYIQSDYTATQALTFLNGKSKKYQASAYNCLAISAHDQKELKESIVFYNKAIELTTSETSKLRYKSNKSIIYRDLKQYKKSISLLEGLLKSPLIEKMPSTSKHRYIDNLTYVKWLDNKELNALPKFLEIEKLRKQNNDLLGLLASYYNLSEFFKEQDKEKALRYAKKRHQLAIKIKRKKSVVESLVQMIELDDSSTFKNYYTEYIRLSDSLQLAKETSKKQFAKIRYHSEENKRRAAEFKAISIEKELLAKKEKLNKKIILLVAIIIFIVLVSYLYIRNQRHKKEKILEVYASEKRISEKIHDELSNDIFTLMNDLQFSDVKKEKLLDQLETVYQQTRNISHENNAIELGKAFKLFFKQMLSGFMSPEVNVILKDLDAAGIENLDSEKQIVVFRVLKELMVNMKKHSKATLVVVSFEKHKSKLNIKYADNGSGCDLKSKKNKNGLLNMENRIKTINGVLNFESEPEKVFKAYIHLKI